MSGKDEAPPDYEVANPCPPISHCFYAITRLFWQFKEKEKEWTELSSDDELWEMVAKPVKGIPLPVDTARRLSAEISSCILDPIGTTYGCCVNTTAAVGQITAGYGWAES